MTVLFKNPLSHLSCFLSLFLFLGSLPGLIAQTPVWTENFTGVANGAGLTTSNTAFNSNNIGSGTSATGVTDTTDIFGSGASNRYIRVQDNAGSAAARLGYDTGSGTLGSKVTTVSFRFINNSTGTSNHLGFRLSTTLDAWTSYNWQLLFNKSGGTGFATTGGVTAETFTYDDSVMNHVQVVANNGKSFLSDYYGTEDLAPGRVDVWMNGVLVGNDIEFTDNALGNNNANFRSFSIQSFNSAAGVDVLLDDLAIYDQAYVAAPPIPQRGTIALSTTATSIGEADGTVTITATRTGGTAGLVSIEYSTADGTATSGVDYTANSGTLTWADGESTDKSFMVTISNDGAYTGDRTFNVALANPGGGVILGTANTSTVIIMEDEPTPPGAAAWVSVDPRDSSSITLTWHDNSANETGFVIERAPSLGGPWTQVHSAAANEDVWTDRQLTANTEYFYRITSQIPDAVDPVSAVFSGSTLPVANDLGRMKQNASNFLRVIGASRTWTRVADALTTLSDDAQFALDTIQANGSWTDVVYSDVVPDDTWTINLHYERLQDLARAWATPGSMLYQDAATLSAALNAIDYIETVINSSSNLSNGNWWWWQIGIPERYSISLFLLRDELGSSRKAVAAGTLDYLIGNSLRRGTEGAQNWIWQGTNRNYHGLIVDSSASINQGVGYITNYVFIATPGVDNGIMPDYTYQAHGTNTATGYFSQLATGQYGASFMVYVPQFTFFAEGTSYQLSAAKQQILADFALEGSRWMVFDQFMDISAEGRAYSRNDRNADNPLFGLMALANTPGSPAQSQAAASAKRILQDWTFPMRPEAAGLAVQVEEMSEAAALPSGFKPYNFSDYAIARTDDWFVSLKTISNRNLIGELINGENLRGRHLSSGVTWLYTGGDYRLNDVLPTLDHDRLPGTTVERGLSLNKAYHYTPGIRSFVGSASTGTGGVSAMDFQSKANNGDSNLQAKKSWFFFDDSFVAVGSGISSTKNLTVETTINQRPMGDINGDILIDSALQSTTTGTSNHTGIHWAHEGEIGYIFPEGADVNMRRVTQTGRWSDIGADDSILHSNPIFSLWFDRGTLPSSAGYVYAVLPTAFAAQTEAAVNNYQILADNDFIHAVKHLAENAAGAVFWQAGEIDRIRVDTPSAVYWKINGSNLQLALTEPAHNTGSIELTFAGDLTPVSLPTGVSSQVSGGATVVTFNVQDGENYACEFTINSLGGLPASSPVVTPQGGFYEAPVNVSMNHPDANATIRYTTDGSDPTSSSPIFSAPFEVTSTTTVKAIAQIAGLDDSPVATHTFSFADAGFFINTGESGYSTDGTSSWQEIDLTSGTGNTNSDPRNVSTFTLADSAGSTDRGITLTVSQAGIGTSSINVHQFAVENDLTGNPFSWFNPAVAAQRDTFVFAGANGLQSWTYAFDGFDPTDTVSFQFVVRRQTANGTRLTTLSGGPVGESPKALYSSQETDEAPQFVTMELTGSGSYAFVLSNTSSSTEWCPVPNAIAVYVADAPSAPPQLTSAESWRDEFFGMTENTGSAADSFDYDGDGLVNLLERAFATDPTSQSDAFSLAGDVVEVGGEIYLALTYRRIRGGSDTPEGDYLAEGILYSVQTSLELVFGNGVVSTLVPVGTPQDNGDGTETVTVRLSTPLESGDTRFLRLKVTGKE